MGTKLQTPLSKAAASGKIANGKVVDTKKKIASAQPQNQKAKHAAPAKKTSYTAGDEDGTEEVTTSAEKKAKAPKAPKEKKLTAKALIAQMVMEQKHTDDEITEACSSQFPDSFKRAYISCTRSDINNGRIHATEAAGRVYNAIYKDESGKILKERPVKTAEKKEPVKKASLNILKKVSSTLPKE